MRVKFPLYASKTIMDLDLDRIDADLGSPDEDTRWQAAIALAAQGHCELAPWVIWPLVTKWGRSSDPDVRAAIATCVLEHILEYHFDEYFPQVAELARTDANFADTVRMCWKLGQAALPENAARFDDLIQDR